jgi:hypothetical protein
LSPCWSQRESAHRQSTRDRQVPISGDSTPISVILCGLLCWQGLRGSQKVSDGQGGSCSYGVLPKSCDAERQSLAEGDICVLSPEPPPSHVTQSGNRWQKAIYVYCPRKPSPTVPGNLAKKESYRNPVPDVFMR